MSATAEDAALWARAAQLRTGPHVTLAFPGSSRNAALRFVLEAIETATPDRPVGVLTRDHVYGGSVPEGTREEVIVVLVDAAIRGETYDGRDDVPTSLVIWASEPSRLSALELIAREELAGALTQG